MDEERDKTVNGEEGADIVKVQAKAALQEAMRRDPRRLGWGFPKHENADGFVLEALHQRLMKERRTGIPPSLLMISDGLPNASGYEGEAAHRHVSEMVGRIVGSGIRFGHLQVGRTPATRSPGEKPDGPETTVPATSTPRVKGGSGRSHDGADVEVGVHVSLNVLVVG